MMLTDEQRGPGRGKTMRRLLTSLLVGILVFVTTGRATHALAPSITVTPVSGNQFQTYTISGSGFTPGMYLDATFTSPDGDDFWTEAAVSTGPAGGFTLTIMPAVDFAGSSAGQWQVTFCVTGGGDCWSATFNVSR
jgi:hypothetical protein